MSFRATLSRSLLPALRRYASASLGAIDGPRLVLASETFRQRLGQRYSQTGNKRLRTVMAAEDSLRKQIELIASLEAMTNDADADMRSLAQADHAAATADLDTLASTLRNLLAPSTLSSDTNALIEVSPGIGGVEASAFADEIADMFISISAAQGWQCTVTRADELDEESAGTSINIKGENAYNLLRLEAGVHRVQRVPASEKQGRIHTSTAAVVVLPVPTSNDRDEAPLYGPNDLVFTNMRSSGAGGQRVNKVETAVRITHTPTGHSIKVQEQRMQAQNREVALMRMEAYLRQLRADEEAKLVKDGRAGQITGTDRSDKIRTYNFPQDRVTDHRVPISVHGIAGVMEGGERWHDIRNAVQANEVDAHIRGILGE